MTTVEVLVILAVVVVHVLSCTIFRRCSCHRCRGTWGLRTFRSRSCDGSHSRSFGEVLDDSKPFAVEGSRARVFDDSRRTHVIANLDACVRRVFVDGSGTHEGSRT